MPIPGLLPIPITGKAVAPGPPPPGPVPVLAELVEFNLNTSPGNQVVPCTQFENNPIAAVFFFGNRLANNGVQSWMQQWLGFGTGAGTANNAFSVARSNHDVSSTTNRRGGWNDNSYRGKGDAGASATTENFIVASLGSNQFTVDVLTAQDAIKVWALVLGGTDMVAGKLEAFPPATPAEVPETGLGFRPGALITLSPTRDSEFETTTVANGIGISDAVSDANVLIYEPFNVSNSRSYRRWVDYAHSVGYANLAGPNRKGRVVSFDPDGLTIDWFEVTGATTTQTFDLALGGCQSAVGTFQTLAATGPQKHTVGFRPEAILFLTTGSNSIADAEDTSLIFSVGASDANKSYQVGGICKHDVSPTVTNQQRSDQDCFAILDENAVTLTKAKLDSVDDDSFTLDYTLADPGTYKVHYLAIGKITSRLPHDPVHHWDFTESTFLRNNTGSSPANGENIQQVKDLITGQFAARTGLETTGVNFATDGFNGLPCARNTADAAVEFESATPLTAAAGTVLMVVRPVIKPAGTRPIFQSMASTASNLDFQPSNRRIQRGSALSFGDYVANDFQVVVAVWSDVAGESLVMYYDQNGTALAGPQAMNEATAFATGNPVRFNRGVFNQLEIYEVAVWDKVLTQTEINDDVGGYVNAKYGIDFDINPPVTESDIVAELVRIDVSETGSQTINLTKFDSTAIKGIVFLSASSNELDGIRSAAQINWGITGPGFTDKCDTTGQMNGLTQSASYRRLANQAIYGVNNNQMGTGGLQITVTSYGSNQFDINTTVNSGDTTPRPFRAYALVLGGADIDINVIDRDCAAATGMETITGIGFEPNGGFSSSNLLPPSFGGGTNQTHSFWGGTVFDAAGRQFGYSGIQLDSQSEPDGYTNRGEGAHFSASTTTNLGRFHNPSADGFDLNWTTLENASRGYRMGLFRAPGSRAGRAVAPVSIGNQTYGCGFKPSMIFLVADGKTSSAANLPDLVLMHGMAVSASEQYCAMSTDRTGTSANTARWSTEAACLVLVDNAVDRNVVAKASFVNMLDDGFELNWTVADGNTYEFSWLALGGDPSDRVTPVATHTPNFGTNNAYCSNGDALFDESTIQKISVSMWFRGTANNTSLLSHWGSSGVSKRWVTEFANNKVQTRFANGSKFQKTINNVVNNNWYHYGYTFDGTITSWQGASQGSFKTYLNGVHQTSFDANVDNDLDFFGNFITNFNLGATNTGTPWVGQLVDVRIRMGDIWTDQDFTDIYNAGVQDMSKGPQLCDYWWGLQDGQNPTLDSGPFGKHLNIVNFDPSFWT